MKRFLILLSILINSTFSYAQFSNSVNFTLLRQDDDVAALGKQKSRSTYEKFKYIPVGKKAYFSLGGSIRFQTESFINEQFVNEEEQDNVWFLNRNMLHAYFNWNDRLEIFGELNNSNIKDKDNLVPVDKDLLSINQAFIKYNFGKWAISVGRENLKIGSRRLFDPREGPNVRRSFDLAQLYYESEKFYMRAFLGTLVFPQEEVFDNEAFDFQETIMGIYTAMPLNESTNLDIYALYQMDDQVTYNAAPEDERRISLGIRHHGEIKSFRFDNEFVYQFGKFGNQDISAWTISFKLENQTKMFGKNFNIGVKTELISGDKDANDNRQNTFDALYPRGAYFGRVARFGPANLIDIHPYINVQLGKFFIEVDHDIFWRYSVGDGLYNPPILPEYADVNDERFIANQQGFLVGYELNQNLTLELETNFIFPGAFLRESNFPDNLYHFVFTSDFKF